MRPVYKREVLKASGICGIVIVTRLTSFSPSVILIPVYYPVYSVHCTTQCTTQYPVHYPVSCWQCHLLPLSPENITLATNQPRLLNALLPSSALLLSPSCLMISPREIDNGIWIVVKVVVKRDMILHHEDALYMTPPRDGNVFHKKTTSLRI